MSAVSLFRLSAQCDLQADFAFTITGCDVEFQPNSNGVGVSHFWTFQTTGVGFTSASNIATPLHTFGAGSGSGFTSRTVTHTVTINGIMYTCTKQIIVECGSRYDSNNQHQHLCCDKPEYHASIYLPQWHCAYSDEVFKYACARNFHRQGRNDNQSYRL